MLDLYICSFVIFQGIRTSIALETLYFRIFSTGGGGGGGSRSPVSDGVRQLLRTFSIAAYPVLEGTNNLVVGYWWKIYNVGESKLRI